MKAINKLCAETGFVFNPEGECGFGRECVGILDPDSDEWVPYEIDDHETYETLAKHSAEVAPNAYHKHPCLAVLGRGEDRVAELEAWVQRILDAGYQVKRFSASPHSISALLGGPRIHKAIVDKGL